jgi:Uma2 family endonuclease
MSLSSPQFRSIPTAEPIDRDGAIPPLEDGDRLTCEEFERRYDAMPNLKKAELIEGAVHVPSPVRQRQHGDPHSTLVGWLFLYRARTRGLELGASPSVRLDLQNTPQPDGALFIQPKYGGQVKIDEEGYIDGAPDLIAEVAAGTTSYDLSNKLEAYQRNGVREYIVVRALTREVA